MKLSRNHNLLIGTIVLFAFFGFIDATYLTVKHYLGTPIPCSLFGDCDVVTNSLYSHIGPIPIALIGAVYYITLIVLCIYYFDSKKILPVKLAAYMTTLGCIVSLFLVYLQIFVIQALCLYCMVSAVLSLILFILGQITLALFKAKAKNSAAS